MYGMKTQERIDSNISANHQPTKACGETGVSSLELNSTFDYPASWYFFSTVRELRRGPVAKDAVGKRLVGFETESGDVAVMENRCIHMGADLSHGCVVGETLQCSLHHWQFDTQGECVHIPASEKIPSFARLASFPVTVRNGNVYFFLGRETLFPLPFYEGCDLGDLVAAKPFTEHIECPWYMVGANGVDVQHFSIAHDRVLQGSPQVTHPHPRAHRAVCHFRIAGNSLGDRLTKHFGGNDVHMEITNWSGTIILVRSTLAKTETFGFLSIVPLRKNQTTVHITVMAKAKDGLVNQQLLDPLRAAVRRILIRKFLRSDIERLKGTRFSPHTLIDADREFADYFHWLSNITRIDSSTA